MAAPSFGLSAPAGPTAATGRPTSEAPLDTFALLRDQVRGTFAFNRTSLVGHFVGALLIGVMFWGIAPRPLVLGWGILFGAVWLGRVVLALRYARREPTTEKRLLARLRTWQAGVLFSGALWGFAAWLFYPYGNGPQQIALVLVVYTFCVACVPILAPQFALFIVFVMLVFVPAIAAVAALHLRESWQLAAVMSVALGMIVVLGRNYRDSFDSVIALKLRTEMLAEQLRAEKAVADEARHEAEVANRAKTQFFTAASHDLRQPLHAMGLFAEALRQRTHEPEVAQLVNSINESVDALEGLFSELLDITRIDSGGVEVNPQGFSVGDIFRKLRLHYEPTAFEKGLGLRFRGGKHVAHADPLLVERILRNLLSNAIRYTADGSVLVSARRVGEIVRLQVWDTGPGIGEEERVRVFEEFYQVPGTPTAALGEHKKGLGLGLAIVKRLAQLMQAPIELRSRVGHGSVFTLDLPIGKASPSGPRAQPGKGPLGLTLGGRLIVIVEDEPAVRQGLEVLLRGWGASIEAFESVAATRVWAEANDPQFVRPALVIADYRLEHGETGVAAIDLLRQRFGHGLPAIVVTGSSMTGHDKEALEHDFHLLIKPVLPNKLRAMIAFKLAGKAKTA
ncbi:MAG: response regulator [Burkholderiales bacterium]|nr:response regulator [Burkholderiales bacterium]